MTAAASETLAGKENRGPTPGQSHVAVLTTFTSVRLSNAKGWEMTDPASELSKGNSERKSPAAGWRREAKLSPSIFFHMETKSSVKLKYLPSTAQVARDCSPSKERGWSVSSSSVLF